jgi:hypothetical protein
MSQTTNAPKRICHACGKEFKERSQLLTHLTTHLKLKKFPCDLCNVTFKESRFREIHLNQEHRCNAPNCKFQHANPVVVAAHRKEHPRPKIVRTSQRGRGPKRQSSPFEEIQAFRGFTKTYRHRVEDKRMKGATTIHDYFLCMQPKIRDIILQNLDYSGSIKCQISAKVLFTRKNIHGLDRPENETDEESETDSESETTEENETSPESETDRKSVVRYETDTFETYINGNMKIFLNSLYFDEVFGEIVNQIQAKTELFERNGSGFVLQRILGCDIRTTQFTILTAGCFIPVPKELRRKKAIISPANGDAECFVWAFLIANHCDEFHNNRERVNQYRKFKHLYDFSGMTFPTNLKELWKFEQKNSQKNFALNVFNFTNKQILVTQLSKFHKDKTRKVINLLYVKHDIDSQGHFMAITSLSKLIGEFLLFTNEN